MTYHYNIEQGSQEWLDLRCGMLTASTIKQIFTPTLKVANNDTTRALVWELSAQRINRYVEPTYVNAAMMHGHRDEVFARELYSEKYAPVTECGYITAEIDGVIVGYSPDGIVGDDGLIEVKSREQKRQLETIISDAIPGYYILQLQMGLLVSGRDWIDFLSYCGGMPMYVKRMYPDDVIQQSIKSAIADFESRVLEITVVYPLAKMGLHETHRCQEPGEIII